MNRTHLLKLARLTAVTILFVVVVVNPAARAVTLETKSYNGVIVALTNCLSDEVLVQDSGGDANWSALHRLNQGDLRAEQAAGWSFSTTNNGFAWTAKWNEAGLAAADWIGTGFGTDRATDDVLVTQAGHTSTNGLVGVSWGIRSVPDQYEILVPGCSGQRFGADAPAQRRTFDYPMMWEAPFVLIQGKRGGVIIWADDSALRFKTLVLDHSQRAFSLRFESRNPTPFEDKQDIVSSRWRIRAYKGTWQVGAAIYRDWASARFRLVPLAEKRPAWAAGIGFVVTMGLDPALLKGLAARCNPAQTLLYLPGWRKDGYDRNYPDYTASPALAPFVAEAHRLGFRVMLHVNYFGCDPKNPLYETFKAWQVRDPFSGELQWWEWPAQPPIKFAYIDPASRAWRELFVKRMAEVIAKTGADALHLDQTLCIYNDKNGLIDGLNCIEGSLALHRELREALPEVALSGEGLNEITSQYENFAQRHIWSMDHVHHTWDDRQVAMCHAISSAVLTPYTQIYGYLGMANPNDTGLFTVWQRAYEHFGVLPTYNWPDKAQLDALSPEAAVVFEQAQFFQQQRPVPDFETQWQPADLFLYRLKGGGSARYFRDQGIAFEDTLHGQKPRVLERRIEGVSEASLPGSIPDWPGFDAKKLIGLNPNEAYLWSPKSRNLAAPHLASLPADYVLGRAGVHEGFARFQIVPSPAAESRNTIRLWDYTGSVTGGVRLATGVVRTFGGLEFSDEETVGNAHPDGDGIFIHPPWKAITQRPGGIRNVTFLDYPLALPDLPSVLFTSGIKLKPGAEGKSDGVTFKVAATSRGVTRQSAAHHTNESMGMLELDLSPWRGKPIVLHLEADPGPAGSPAFDWGRFVRPRIVAQDNRSPAPQPVRLVGFALPEKFLLANGAVELSILANNPGTPAEFQATCCLPNTLIVPITAPNEVALPVDLLKTPFNSHLLFGNGIEQAPRASFRGTVIDAKCAGQTQTALSAHPPPMGKLLVDWWIRLPATPALLVTAAGIRDGATSNGVEFAIEVNGRRVFGRTAHPDAGWLPVELSLAEWAGQPVVITFITDSTADNRSPLAAWAAPHLLPER